MNIDIETECQYNREQKKRGKAPRKEFPQRAAAKYSCNSTGKLRSIDATATKKKAKKSEAFDIGQKIPPHAGQPERA